MNPTYQGEVMLLGWSESHNGGAKVTFQLSDPSDLESFKSMTLKKGKVAGQRLACVLVEIGDDENPVEAEPPQLKGGELAKLAGQWCNREDFQQWLGVLNADGARREILDRCGVSSRRELDHDQAAAQRFHNLFRIPFIDHMRTA